MSYKKGISLVSLVITIIVLLIVIGIIIVISLDTNLFNLVKETKTDAIVADIHDYGKASKSTLALNENINEDNIVDLFIEQVETENEDREEVRKYVVVASDTINKTVTLRKEDVEAVIDLKDLLSAAEDVAGIDKENINLRYTISFIYKVDKKEQIKKMVLLRNQSLQDYLDSSGEFVPTEVDVWTPNIDYDSPTTKNIEYREYKRKLERVVAHFDLSGGKLNGSPVIPSKEYFAGDTIEDVGIPSKEFHVFNGWNPSIAEPIIENTTYVAQWSLVKYTFTFNLNGGNIGGSTANRTIIGEHGSPSTTPGSPVRTHYTFSGWDPSVPSTFDGNTTFTAQWTPIIYTFTFNLNGGNIAGSTANPITVGAYGTPATTPANPTRTHYTFNGWNPSVPSTYTENSTYTAQWTAVTYTFTFNLNGGNIGGATANQTRSGVYNTTSSSPTNPTRTHYTFSGWSPIVPSVFDGNKTFTAQWAAVTYTFTFNLNGGNIGGSTANRTTSGLYGSSSTIPGTPVRTHYTFNSWSPSVPNTYTGNNTYIAQWAAVTYTFTFNLNGGNIGGSTSNRTTSGLYGTASTKPANPVRTHYTFNAWSPAVPSTYTGNNTYTATWTAVTYTYTFKLNGGNIGGLTTDRTTSGAYGSNSSIPVNPVRTYYTFTGWSPTVPSTYTGNNTYTAQWTINSYTITYNLDGGSYSGSTGTYTTSVQYNSMPPNFTPTKSGYVFLGWNPALTVVTGAKTYLALWSKPMIIQMKKASVGESILIPITIPSGGFVLISNNNGDYAQRTDSNPTFTNTVAANTAFTMKIAGRITRLSFYNATAAQKNQMYKINDWGELSPSNYQNGFRGCTKLVGPLPSPTANSFSNITYFSSCFQGCTSLSGSIPSNLFLNCNKVIWFYSIFEGCTGLTGAIPASLFSSCTNVTRYDLAFKGCTGLTGTIPAALFSNSPNVEDFYCTFEDCTGLTGSIPSNLFNNKTKVTRFTGTFQGCTGLTTISANLFSGCTSAENFSFTFAMCTGLGGPIPSNIFNNCSSVTSYSGAFMYCSGITGAIPSALFSSSPNTEEMVGVFMRCTSLTGPIPGALFANNTKLHTLNAVFSYCTNLSGSIPSNLFANNKEIIDFGYTFEYCGKLTGSIPSTLFNNNTKVINFTSTFLECRGLTGNAPALWNRTPTPLGDYCFRNCTGLSNYSSIPSAWR